MVIPLSPKRLLAIALLFGTSAAALLYQASLGFNVAIIGLLAVFGCITLNKRSEFKITKTSLLFLGFSAFFALMFAFRDAPGLQVANMGALLIAFGGSLYLAKDSNQAKSSLPALIFQPIARIFQTIPWAISLNQIIQKSRPKNPDRTKNSSSIMIGATVATPLLFVFGGLFYSADAMFKSHVDSVTTLNFDPTNAVIYLSLAATLTILAAGTLYRFFIQSSYAKPPIVNEFIGPPQFAPIHLSPALKLGPIEINVVLGSLVTLFAAFIASQFHSLFGGALVIAKTTGLSASEYARSGFFQLVWVAALSLATILWLDKIQSAPSKATSWLNRSLIALVLCVIGSAALRMAVYTQSFGLTELRLYTSVFMIWVALAFAWLIPTITANRRHKFGFGALLAGFSVIALMNFANPEAIITRTNLAMNSPDLQYIASLSADARVEWQNNPAITPKTRKMLIDRTYSKRNNLDWRSTNLSKFLEKKY